MFSRLRKLFKSQIHKISNTFDVNSSSVKSPVNTASIRKIRPVSTFHPNFRPSLFMQIRPPDIEKVYTNLVLCACSRTEGCLTHQDGNNKDYFAKQAKRLLMSLCQPASCKQVLNPQPNETTKNLIEFIFDRLMIIANLKLLNWIFYSKQLAF